MTALFFIGFLLFTVLGLYGDHLRQQARNQSVYLTIGLALDFVGAVGCFVAMVWVSL